MFNLEQLEYLASIKALTPSGFELLETARMKAKVDAMPVAVNMTEQAITSGAIKEADPHGVAQHTPGAKLDAGKVRPSLIFNDMPRALLAVAEVGTFGANKYSDGGWQYVLGGINRYTDAMDRHRLKEFTEGSHDKDSELLHAAHLAWNALARLELMLREKEAAK